MDRVDRGATVAAAAEQAGTDAARRTLAGCNAVAFSPDGILATGSADSTAKLWNRYPAEAFRR